MLEPAALVVITLTFLLAGMVKGVIGMGLPTVSLALLTLFFGLPEAMGLLLAPSFITNLWQAMVGGHLRMLIIRLWSFLIPAAVLIGAGVWLLARWDAQLLTILLGISVIAYSALGLAGIRPRLAGRMELWTAPLAGGLTGLLTGLTGSFVMPGVIYLQSLGLDRHQLVQAMGMLFLVCTITLGAGLQGLDMLSGQTATLSAAAVLPALAGMVIGQKLRARLSEQAFRRFFFAALISIGALLILN